MKLPHWKYVVSLAALGMVIAVLLLTVTRRSTVERIPVRSLDQLVDLSANPLNVNRLEDAILILMKGRNLSTQQKFEETFASFKHRPLTENENSGDSPPLDFEKCVHVKVLLLAEAGKAPLNPDDNVAVGITSWYLTAAFSKESGVCQWWYIWESYVPW